jgi:transcriptional regulator with XRE-family HTH domain
MGKEVRGKLAAPALSGDPERSIGAYLARQRELRGISVEELATLTRIPRRSLERLESGVFDRAPDGFVRGFVRTVALALGLDPDAAVMRLLSEPPVDPDAQTGIARWRSPSARFFALGFAGVLAVGFLGWLVASRSQGRVSPRADDAVMRRDPIRELAREVERRAGLGGEPAVTALEAGPETGATPTPTGEPGVAGPAIGPSQGAPPVDSGTPPAAPAPAH